MNKNELRAAMARHGDRAEDLAKVIGMTPNTFSDKINGKSDFRQAEIQTIIDRYGLGAKETFLIFFTPDVSANENAV